MTEIFLSTIKTPENERVELINRLDEIFKDCQLVVSPAYWGSQYFPIKSIKHFIANSPTYKASAKDLIVWFYPIEECLVIKNINNARVFALRLAEKKYLEDFPYIYEGKLNAKNDYIIPIKFR